MSQKKIIIELAGGLGNQMYQYAFYLKMKHLGYQCGLYYDREQQKHNGPELDKVFNIELNFVPGLEIDKLLDRKGNLYSRLKRKIFGTQPSFYWEHDKGYAFKPEIFTQERSIYLQGCWLSYKYFKDIEANVRSAFTFGELTGDNINVLHKINTEKNPVSIHIRKGDYVSSGVHLNIDYKAYLSKAISYINERVSGASFYVFSDDMEFAKDMLEKYKTICRNIFFIDWNKGAASYRDMQLMANSRHNIISNSTFSWWAAWLNTSKDNIVISPKDWFTVNEWNKNSIVPGSWIAV